MRQAQSESGSSATRIRTGGESGCRVFWRWVQSFDISDRGRYMAGDVQTRGDAESGVDAWIAVLGRGGEVVMAAVIN